MVKISTNCRPYFVDPRQEGDHGHILEFYLLLPDFLDVQP